MGSTEHEDFPEEVHELMFVIRLPHHLLEKTDQDELILGLFGGLPPEAEMVVVNPNTQDYLTVRSMFDE